LCRVETQQAAKKREISFKFAFGHVGYVGRVVAARNRIRGGSVVG
jgi:hypothetical protein